MKFVDFEDEILIEDKRDIDFIDDEQCNSSANFYKRFHNVTKYLCV